MNKEEFEKTKDPLTLVVSLDPTTGKCMFDYYEYDGTDYWLNKIKTDFPDHHVFMKINPAAIEERKRQFGLIFS